VEPLEYLRAIRRRWVVIVAAVVVAGALAWMTTTVAPVATGRGVQGYQATVVILASGTSPVGGITLAAMPGLVTIPNVADRVAKDLQFRGNSALLSGAVQVDSNTEGGLLKITAADQDPKRARLLANAFARDFISFLGDRQKRIAQAQSAQLTDQIRQLTQTIRQLNAKLNSATGVDQSLLASKRTAAESVLTTLETQNQQAVAASVGQALQIIQQAVPLPITSGSGFQAPRSSGARVLVAILLALPIGVALVLVLERFDTRVRSRQAAEKHFQLPVLAEIPAIPRRHRKEVLPRSDGSHSPTANAYRFLAASLSSKDEDGTAGNGHRLVNRGRAILVTSPAPGDGKTSTVAQLAASYTERGKKVLVLSCDFHHPDLDRVFLIKSSPGLSDGLARGDGNGPPILFDTVQRSLALPGVHAVASGLPPDRPAKMLGSPAMRRALAEARQQADIVLVDTSPLLTSSEVTPLLSEVDSVLIVARAGKTSTEVADRTGDLLKRLGVPVAGVALNAIPGSLVGRDGWYVGLLRDFPIWRGTRKDAKV
jgi:Mrp family chromosome partitioning ATPase